MRRSGIGWLCALAALPTLLLAAVGRGAVHSSAQSVARFEGRLRDAAGAPVVGAMVTFLHGEPIHALTVFSDELGHYRSTPLPVEPDYSLRVRRIGWKELRVPDQRLPAAGGVLELDLTLERETDPAQVAAQLPANHWYALVLERIPDAAQREELVRQCTYCHQQGNEATRRLRDEEEWRKVLALMARMGGFLSDDLRAQLPALFNGAYDPAHAVPALTAGMQRDDFAPPPPAEVRRAVIEEWELGHRASMQHDLVFHRDGRIYSVDMTQDKLYRLDVRDGGTRRESFDIPQGDLPLGGFFGGRGDPIPPNANAHVGPHSLQVAADGSIWITLALGNQLARFDPQTGEWSTHSTGDGYYPHTLRFDQRGRIWYTLAASNHLGMLDPQTGEHRQFRLPARTLRQAVVLRLLPALLWLNRRIDLRGRATAGEGMTLPVPYGIDVAPDGGVWFSQLNEHRIGRMDPDSFELELIDTPFTAPRRLRFDSKGKLWIPGFSAGVVSRFDPVTREFESFALPIDPPGSAIPYALNVDRRSDTVWICGTNSDSLIRFEPATERFTVFPLPTRVTYTREIDFDAEGRIWTSNSNVPTWQIEGGYPRLLRLDPNGFPLEVSLRSRSAAWGARAWSCPSWGSAP